MIRPSNVFEKFVSMHYGRHLFLLTQGPSERWIMVMPPRVVREMTLLLLVIPRLSRLRRFRRSFRRSLRVLTFSRFVQ